MDVLTKQQRSNNMRAIKSKQTKIELKLAKALWSRGWRYRKNDKKVFGTPDLSFSKYKLAVFADSEFWHGRNWSSSKLKIKTNQTFWWNKIEANRGRDRRVNKELKRQGWKVLRFWGKQIDKNLEVCIFKIESEIRKLKRWGNTQKSSTN